MPFEAQQPGAEFRAPNGGTTPSNSGSFFPSFQPEVPPFVTPLPPENGGNGNGEAQPGKPNWLLIIALVLLARKLLT